MGIVLREAKMEFARRLLDWSLAESEQEVTSDYALLRTLRSYSVGQSLGYLESIPEEKRRFLGSARAKYVSTAFPKEQLSQEERTVLEQDFRYGCLYSKSAFEKVAILDGKLIHDKNAKKLFRAELVRSVISELGEKPVRGSGVNPLIVKKLGDWEILFDLDFGNRHEPEVRLSQMINRRDATIGNVWNDSLLRPIRLGLSENLGLGESAWGLSYYADLNEIIEPVLEEIRYMLAPLSSFIKGLDI